jgi:phosphatidylserine/phosphatidylglycerophosphate/cardiolipin synthase-like enzyme
MKIDASIGLAIVRSTAMAASCPAPAPSNIRALTPARRGSCAVVRIDDWFLRASERGNPATTLDSRRGDGLAWTTGNEVRPLVHGAAYFAELASRLGAMDAGDLLLFTDWRGDPDERLGPDGPEIGRLFAQAARRGVIVRGLVWRSHWDRLQFSGEENRQLGDVIDAAGGQCLLDMRVRVGGSHHMKMVVLRHPGRPELDVAFVGGIDLCHSRRDDEAHHGDPQAQNMARVYGERPPWHDIQAMIRGPAVGDVEAVFRERWNDPVPITLNPLSRLHDLVDRKDDTANRLPGQEPDPAPRGPHAVQILRTYPFRRPGFSFAPKGERSIARGYLKVLARAQSLVYVEDQYLWCADVVDALARALAERPQLRLIAVIPRYPDMDGRISMPPNLVGRIDAMRLLRKAGGDRVGVYWLENEAGTPIYVHAKVCVVDDTWSIIGSDNFNRRSWTHDSELSCAVLDMGGSAPAAAPGSPAEAGVRTLELQAGDNAAELTGRSTADLVAGDALATATAEAGSYPVALRSTLCGEHLGAALDPEAGADLIFRSFWQAASALDAWHANGRQGRRPPGQLRHYLVPELTWRQRLIARPLYRLVYDPDGRPHGMRRRREF